MEIQLRANQQQADYMIHLLREEDGLQVNYVVPESPVKYDTNGYGVHWLRIKGTRTNPAAEHVTRRLLNYSSDLIEHLNDARRVLLYIAKK